METGTRKLFNAIDEVILQLFYRWKISQQLFCSGMDNLNLLNRSGSNVFALLQALINDNIFLTIARLTDPDRTGAEQNLSLKTLFAAVEGDLEDSVRKVVEEKLAQLEMASKNLRKHRNKSIAHSDLENAIKVKTLPSVTIGGLEDGLEIIRSIMKDIWLALFNSSVWYDPHIAYGCDGKGLLEILRRAHSNETMK